MINRVANSQIVQFVGTPLPWLLPLAYVNTALAQSGALGVQLPSNAETPIVLVIWLVHAILAIGMMQRSA